MDKQEAERGLPVERTQASKDHVPLYVEKQKSVIDEIRLSELLTNGAAMKDGGDLDWLEAQAKVGASVPLHIMTIPLIDEIPVDCRVSLLLIQQVRKARREGACDETEQERPQRRPKTKAAKGKAKSKAATKPVGSGALQQIEEGATDQPIEEGATDQPIEEGAAQPIEEGAAQPIEEGAAQPIEEGATQPIEEGAAQPIEEGAAHQPIEEGAPLQPIEEGAPSQPIDQEGEPSQSIDQEGEPSQSIDQEGEPINQEGEPIKPSMVTGACGLAPKIKKGDVLPEGIAAAEILAQWRLTATCLSRYPKIPCIYQFDSIDISIQHGVSVVLYSLYDIVTQTHLKCEYLYIHVCMHAVAL